MPQGASEIAGELYLRLLVMGPPKAGKTQTCVTTCEGPVLLINCDPAGAVAPAVRNWKRRDGSIGAVAGDEFDIERVEDLMGMEKALSVARKGVKAGKYNTIILDPITTYAGNIEQQLADSTDDGKGPDGRRYWPEYTKRLKNTVSRLFRLEAHIIVTAHFLHVGGETIEGQTPKTGPGIAPELAGKARLQIPAMFQDVVFFEKRNGKRVFVTSIDGVWGPGCRSLGVEVVPGNIRILMKKMGIRKIGPRMQVESPAAPQAAK